MLTSEGIKSPVSRERVGGIVHWGSARNQRLYWRVVFVEDQGVSLILNIGGKSVQ
jgi:hypothetical protein